MSGLQPLSRCLYKDPRSNTLLLSTPRPLRDSHLITGSRAFAQLINHLRHTADLVIVDVAPAMTTEETPVTGHVVDAVLMVAASERPDVTGAIDAMQNTGSPPIGVVLATA
jgi:Mrp family chromosome partitioning ATPase